MFVPLWLIILNVLIVFVLLGKVLRGSGDGDMIEQQRQQAAPAVRPQSHEAQQLLARPDIAQALREGRTIQAIKLVREATGMGLKQSKQLVDGHKP